MLQSSPQPSPQETCAPDAPQHRDLLKGVRTSVCEFTFTWLSRYKHATKHMQQLGFQFFLTQMLDLHNEMLVRGNTQHLPEAPRRPLPRRESVEGCASDRAASGGGGAWM